MWISAVWRSGAREAMRSPKDFRHRIFVTLRFMGAFLAISLRHRVIIVVHHHIEPLIGGARLLLWRLVGDAGAQAIGFGENVLRRARPIEPTFCIASGAVTLLLQRIAMA